MKKNNLKTQFREKRMTNLMPVGFHVAETIDSPIEKKEKETSTFYNNRDHVCIESNKALSQIIDYRLFNKKCKKT